jgi:hypothetical protein
LWLAGLGIPAVAIDYRTARIADGDDMLKSGVVSVVNEVAARHGCLPGHTARQAAKCLLEIDEETDADVPDIGESRARIGNTGHRAVWAIDSASLVRAEDRRAIVLTGSHGALLGGKPDHVLGVDAFAAFFNDAGGGKDGAGFSGFRFSTSVASRQRRCRTIPRASEMAARPMRRAWSPASTRPRGAWNCAREWLRAKRWLACSASASRRP